MTWYNYILRSEVCNSTYNGKTNDPSRRIRQHNGEITGGAKATSSKRPWKFICLISGFIDEKDALRAEWRIKHPSRKKKREQKYCRPEGRIKGLNNILQNFEKWTSNCESNNADKYVDEKLTINILQEYRHLLVDVPDYCEVIVKEILP